MLTEKLHEFIQEVVTKFLNRTKYMQIETFVQKKIFLRLYKTSNSNLDHIKFILRRGKRKRKMRAFSLQQINEEKKIQKAEIFKLYQYCLYD